MPDLNLRNHGGLGAPPRAAGLGTFGRIALFLLIAAIGYLVFNPPRSKPFDPLPIANANSTPRAVRNIEFETLYGIGRPFARLSRPARYTVVEVYIDGCIYCEEIEGALRLFNKRRADVSWFRVHHPGEMRVSLAGLDQEEAQSAISRIESYGICGTPHIEVYGPDREPLAVDSCTSRDGTAFMWDWITHETGRKSRLSLKGTSRFRQTPPYMFLVKILFGVLVIYGILLVVQDRLENGHRWWHSRFWREDLW